jgi:hypothetical protein
MNCRLGGPFDSVFGVGQFDRNPYFVPMNISISVSISLDTAPFGGTNRVFKYRFRNVRVQGVTAERQEASSEAELI